jgi:hypothetical protein
MSNMKKLILGKTTFLISFFSVFSFIFTGIACNSSKDPKNMTVVKPVEIDSSFSNPGRGFATTGRVFNKDVTDVPRYPRSGIVQIRRYWDQLEPKRGEIRFAMIDSILDEAQKEGQQMVFRVMNQNVKMRLPKWVVKEGVKKGATDPYDNPVFLREQKKLIKALAQRYDGDPRIAFIDIGTVGQWAEWHTTMEGQGIKMPSKKNQKKIIDWYVNGFKKTPLVMQIGGARNGMLHYAISKGAGWRADCWGGYGKVGFHSMEKYPKLLSKARAYNAWKHAPVALEPCYTMKKWVEEDWDFDKNLSKALQWHASVVHNGDQSIPKEYWPKVKKFERKVGYRFVLEELKYPSTVKSGTKMNYIMKWKNAGDAPIYYNYPLAFRFRATEDSSKSFVVKTNARIKKWMPGESTIKSKVKIPKDISPGKYHVDIGILNPETGKPMINLAIKGKTHDGWYEVGNIKFGGL